MPELFFIGRNDGGHIAELKNSKPDRPVVFNKAFRSLRQGSELSYSLEEGIGDIHFEAELVLVVGRPIQAGQRIDLSRDIRGWSLGLDLTARDLQNALKEKGLPWFRSKSRRSFTLLGPEQAATVDFDWKGFEFFLHLNQQLRQHGQVSKLLFGLDDCVSACAEVLDLEPGDCVFTGTPAGVGKMSRGDKLELSTPQHGNILTVHVV